MRPILQPDKTKEDSKIVSFRVPEKIHRQLHKVSDAAKSMGMKLSWQDLLRESLAEYVRLADKELTEYGKTKPEEHCQ